MNYEAAEKLIRQGRKIRLPEWTGYWYIAGDEMETELYAFTRTGEQVPAWSGAEAEEHAFSRTDWELVETDGLGFDFAILAMKAGKRVMRLSWKGLRWVSLVKNEESLFWHTQGSETFAMYVHFCIMVGDNTVRPGWTPSQTDMIATDWVVYE